MSNNQQYVAPPIVNRSSANSDVTKPHPYREAQRCPHGHHRSACTICLVDAARAQRDWMADVLVSRWHDGHADLGTPLHEWMEWTEEQYARWLENPANFPDPPAEEATR